MLGLFGKNKNTVAVKDQIWLTSEAKWEACVRLAQTSESALFIAWFEETKEQLQELLQKHRLPNSCYLAAETVAVTPGRVPFFVEHYPLSNIEQKLFTTLRLKEVPVLSALDEPLFTLFGGSRLQEMMTRLGEQENEILAHDFISRAIRNAQSKIASKVKVEKKSTSQAIWFEENKVAP